MPDLLVRVRPLTTSEATFCHRLASPCCRESRKAYKISQMNMSIGIQENVVGLDVSVDDILGVHVSQGASQFSNPESDRLFGKCLSRDVESQITARHQIDYKIPIAAGEPLLCCKVDRGRTGAYMYSMSWKLYLKLQMKGWLTYSSIRRSRMMLRTLSDRTTAGMASRLAQLEDNRHCTTRKDHADDCRYRHE